MKATERQRRLLKPVSITIGVVLTILALAFLYSKFGGEWASSLVIPIPPSSDFVGDHEFTNGLYENRLSLYKTKESLQETREWFVTNHIPMSPVDGVTSSEDKSYYSLPMTGTGRSEYNLLFTVAHLSANPKAGSYETSPNCFGVRVYKSLDDVDYPDFRNAFSKLTAADFENINAIVLIQSCWPSW